MKRLRKKVEAWMAQQGDEGMKSEAEARKRLEKLYQALRERLRELRENAPDQKTPDTR